MIIILYLIHYQMMYPLIGRSTNDKVQKYGVSLPKDYEVSSYHGKVRFVLQDMMQFFIRGGQLKYKDTNSTNYSFVNEYIFYVIFDEIAKW